MAQKMAVDEPLDNRTGDIPLQIRRGEVDSVELYEIKENELELLESGSAGDTFLHLAVFLFSIAFAAVASLVTTVEYKYPIFQFVFVVVAVVGFIGALVLFAIWRQSRRSLKGICKKIRGRMPPLQKVSEITASSFVATLRADIWPRVVVSLSTSTRRFRPTVRRTTFTSRRCASLPRCVPLPARTNANMHN
jgi:hypothetical protein